MMYKIELYETISGKHPYAIWLDSLDDFDASKISIRLDRLSLGNFSNSESIGDGAHEIKIDFGPGYRVYYAILSAYRILILNAGTKRTQAKDIKKAKEYLNDYKTGVKHGKK